MSDEPIDAVGEQTEATGGSASAQVGFKKRKIKAKTGITSVNTTDDATGQNTDRLKDDSVSVAGSEEGTPALSAADAGQDRDPSGPTHSTSVLQALAEKKKQLKQQLQEKQAGQSLESTRDIRQLGRVETPQNDVSSTFSRTSTLEVTAQVFAVLEDDEPSAKTGKPKSSAPLKKQHTAIRTVDFIEYQVPICKDFLETGRCGYGDACQYLHDRTNYKSGAKIEEEYKKKQEEFRRIALGMGPAAGSGDSQGKDGDVRTFVADDGQVYPEACPICQGEFQSPVVTLCEHYFCEECALKQNVKDGKCFVCHKATDGVFNMATRLESALQRRRKRIARAEGNDVAEDVTDRKRRAVGDTTETKSSVSAGGASKYRVEEETSDEEDSGKSKQQPHQQQSTAPKTGRKFEQGWNWGVNIGL